MDDIEEKHIYKNALKRIVELDLKLNDSILNQGYVTGCESRNYFTEAVGIARKAISEGAMRYVSK